MMKESRLSPIVFSLSRFPNYEKAVKNLNIDFSKFLKVSLKNNIKYLYRSPTNFCDVEGRLGKVELMKMSEMQQKMLIIPRKST